MISISYSSSRFTHRSIIASLFWLLIAIVITDSISAQQSPIAEIEYEVLRQFIQDTFDEYPQVIISDSTVTDKVNYSHADSPYIIRDFEVKNRERKRLDEEFLQLSDKETIFVNESYLRELMNENNQRFILDIIFEKYPKSKGILSITRVAFNMNQDVAIFSYTIFDKMYQNPSDEFKLIQYKKVSGKWLQVDFDIDN